MSSQAARPQSPTAGSSGIVRLAIRWSRLPPRQNSRTLSPLSRAPRIPSSKPPLCRRSFQESRDNRFTRLGESFRRQLSAHYFRHTGAMSFKSFDFFVQRTTTTSTTSERDIIDPVRFVRKSGKLGRNDRAITCHTTGTLATYKDRQSSANSPCRMFRIANRTQKVLNLLKHQSPAEPLADESPNNNQRRHPSRAWQVDMSGAAMIPGNVDASLREANERNSCTCRQEAIERLARVRSPRGARRLR